MKQLDIEWRHLDQAGNTCIRCSDTGVALKKVVASLTTECAPCGWEVTFKETRLKEDQIAQSNIILINGTPIEEILPNSKVSENHCVSCCDFIGGESVYCRTIEYEDKTYEAIPARLVHQAVCSVAQCC